VKKKKREKERKREREREREREQTMNNSGFDLLYAKKDPARRFQMNPIFTGKQLIYFQNSKWRK